MLQRDKLKKLLTVRLEAARPKRKRRRRRRIIRRTGGR